MSDQMEFDIIWRFIKIRLSLTSKNGAWNILPTLDWFLRHWFCTSMSAPTHKLRNASTTYKVL